jgi:hypothetical protein
MSKIDKILINGGNKHVRHFSESKRSSTRNE